MFFSRRSTAEVVRRGVGDEPTEERTTRKIGRRTVKVRRVRELPTRPTRVGAPAKEQEEAEEEVCPADLL